MTLQETVNIIERVAMRQPSVNMIVKNDIFRLNAAPAARYGVFAWLQNQHSASVEGDTIKYNFTLFYVDRLTEDEANQVEVQSTGIVTIDNIIKLLSDRGIYADPYTFQPFNQRFVDNCAGVFCTVAFTVPAGLSCSEDFGDFNNDFNDDFMIY